MPPARGAEHKERSPAGRQSGEASVQGTIYGNGAALRPILGHLAPHCTDPSIRPLAACA